MAGDWIKMRVDLEDDPAVIQLSERTGLDSFGVIGRLHQLWSWANKHSDTGVIARITPSLVDKRLAAPGFAEVLEQEGWLRFSDAGVEFINFDRHNGASAKKRAANAERQERHRDRREEAPSTSKTVTPKRDKSVTEVAPQRDDCVTREEKRREEEVSPNGDTGGKPQKRFTPPTVEEVRAYCLERNNRIDPEAFVAHYAAAGWKRKGGAKIVDWKAAVITWEKNDFPLARGQPTLPGVGPQFSQSGRRDGFRGDGIRAFLEAGDE